LEPTKDLPGHHWSVEMAVVQKINEGQNFPYTFHITMEGMYACKDGVLKTEAEIQFVKVNGSSMLYVSRASRSARLLPLVLGEPLLFDPVVLRETAGR